MDTTDPTDAADRYLTRVQFSLLIGGLLTTAIGQSFIFAILPPLGRDVGFNEIQINTLISSSALVFSLSSAWWGRFSDTAGRKRVILAGLTGYSVGNLLFALVFEAGLHDWLAGTTLFVTALAVRCTQALTMSATTPGTGAYAADYTAPSHRTRALARLGTANSLGMIFGPIVAGALAGFGLLFPLYTATVLAAGAVVVLARYLPADLHAPGSHRGHPRLRVLDPRVRLFLLCSTGSFTGFSGIQQTLGFRLQDMLGLTGTETAQHTGIALMATALCTFAMQMTVAQRYQGAPIVLVRAGLGLLLMGALGIALADGFILILFAMAAMGAGLGLSVPAIAAGASLAVTPQEQGAAAGLVTACPAAGFVIGPIACGLLYTVDPTLSALGAGAVLLVVLLAALLGHRVRRQR